jgi:phage-related tail protein
MADDGSGFLSGISFTIKDAVTNVTGAVNDVVAAAGGGGFTMSRDEMESMLTKATGTLKLIGDQLISAANIARIDPPGDDSSSIDFTNVAIDSGNAYLKHLDVQKTRYQSLIDKLNQALGHTVETDQQAADALPKPGAEGTLT